MFWYCGYMPIVSCEECLKEFYIKPNRLAKGWGRFCSNECKHLGSRTGQAISCTTCGKPTYKSQKDLRRSKSGSYFCSKSCQTIWRNSVVYTGRDHPNWKGGEYSYRDALSRSEAPKACTKCGSQDSRVLAVHHKDRNRQNNEISNLLWLCHNCHFLVHHFPTEAEGFLTR